VRSTGPGRDALLLGVPFLRPQRPA
jgi:hypothetical protein